MLNVQEVFVNRRKVLHLSQDKVAKSLDITRRQYKRIEIGKASVNETNKACEVLGLKMFIVSKEGFNF